MNKLGKIFGERRSVHPLAFNAQGSRLIIRVVQLGAVKIYVAAVGGAQERGKTG
jgi:hypothetical protein